MIHFRPLPVASIATLLALIILVTLGRWQLERLAWKEDLIRTAEARASAEPVPLGAIDPTHTAAELDYTHIRLTGRFDHAREIYLHSAGAGRIGFEVVTPLMLGDGREILVNRGFVPKALKDPARRSEGQIEGETELTGLLRFSEEGNAFSPEPDLAARVFYIRDLAAMQKTAPLKADFPFLVALDEGAVPGGYPQGGMTRLTFRNDHLSYALTWFSLAAVLLAVYLAYHWAEGRLRFGPPAS